MCLSRWLAAQARHRGLFSRHLYPIPLRLMVQLYLSPVIIYMWGEEVEVVEGYRYLGVHLEV